MSSRRRRKLAAILMADVAGFSRLMGRDEDGTTARILEFHEQVRETVEEHGGRVVATAGDSVFGDFDSIVDALDCAIVIQTSLHAANRDLPQEDRIEARIGLHLGDVIVEERNVFGDGVNVAARLEQLADPGGIMLSEAAYHLVRGRTELPIQAIGAQTLKNIDAPVEVFRIPPDAFGGGTPASPDIPGRGTREETRERIRDAVTRIVESAADGAERAEESDALVINASDEGLGRGVAAPIRAGTLPVLTLGVLGVLARTTGWSDNAWYPFLGSWMLGVGVGAVVGRLTRRRGLSTLIVSAGIGVGAIFFENVVARSIIWVLAAGLLGTAIRKLTGEAGTSDRGGQSR